MNSQELKATLERIDPTIRGLVTLNTQGGVTTILGSVTSKLNRKDLNIALQKAVPNSFPSVQVARAVVVTAGTAVAPDEGGLTIDVLYRGPLHIESLKETTSYKRTNSRTKKALTKTLGVLGYAAPIIVDSQLNVIDGNLRLRSLREEYSRGAIGAEVEAVVIGGNQDTLDYLRIVLNRLSEFQRWDYPALAAYMDAHPQAQALLEDLGVYGKDMIDPQAWAPTVLGEHKELPKPEDHIFDPTVHSLEDWAKIQASRVEALRKAEEAYPLVPETAETVSLFDLEIASEHQLEVWDVEAEEEAIVERMKHRAGVITDNYDKKRRAEKEAKGQAWQTTRRSTKQIVAEALGN